MPNPKKPMALRERDGTAHRNKQRNNDDAPEPSRGIGPPPNYLNPEQIQIWDEIVGTMYRGVLGEADRTSFELLVRLVYDMRNNFEDMNGAKLSQLNSVLSKFGMTPSDRTRIVIPKEKNKNPFDIDI